MSVNAAYILRRRLRSWRCYVNHCYLIFLLPQSFLRCPLELSNIRRTIFVLSHPKSCV